MHNVDSRRPSAAAMRMLLTGATGYIGRHLVESLLGRGAALRVLALPGTEHDVPYRDRVEVVTGELSHVDVLRQAALGMEIVYHLAAQLPGTRGATLRSVNVDGTRNVVDACVAMRPRRLILMSSVAVYAPALSGVPVAEDQPLEAHGSLAYRDYAQSKIDAERLLQKSCVRHGLDHVIVRAPAVYGPHAQWIERALLRILASPLTALRKARNSPSMQWIYVNDLVQGLMLAGTVPSAANGVFNVAGGE